MTFIPLTHIYNDKTYTHLLYKSPVHCYRQLHRCHQKHVKFIFSNQFTIVNNLRSTFKVQLAALDTSVPHRIYLVQEYNDKWRYDYNTPLVPLVTQF